MTKPRCIAIAIAAALFLICGAASAQSITIVSGNGQLACEACPRMPIITFDPMVVQVKDAAGKLLPGATVTWTFNSAFNTASASAPPPTITDANGMATANFFLSPNLGQLFATSFVQGTFTAAVTALPTGTSGTTGQSVTFTESDALTDSQAGTGQNGFVLVGTSQVLPAAGVNITGPAGSTLPNAIQISVNGTFAGTAGTAVPGVAVVVIPPSSGPSISCATGPGGQPNIALTNSSGFGTCNVVFGSVQGTGTANVAVGQLSHPFATFNVNFTTTQGIPGGIQINTGNNQSGNAGAPLPAPLVATVVDQAGNAINGVNVTWTVTSGTATLFNQRTISDLNGKVSANLTLGSSAGPVVVTVAVANSTPSISANFNATVTVSVTGLQKVSGDNQTAIVNTAFPAPLVVQATNNGQTAQGVAVNFVVTSGSGSVSAASATTNAQGQAQVTATAGATQGGLVITATIPSTNFTQTFNLTVAPPGPAITPATFYNAASLVSGAISPCSLATIIAPGLAPGLQGAILPPLIGQLPLQVFNDSVAFLNPQTNANINAPIWDVANINGQEQMTIEIPCELSPGNVDVTVNVGVGSKKVTLALKSAAPGIFQTVGSDRVVRAVLVRQDGSYVAKENPARRGETVYLFVTGLGPVIPQIGTNQIGIPGTISSVSDLSTIVVGVNNGGVQVVSAAYANDLIGIYVVGFVVPPDAPTGDLPLAIAVVQAGNFVFGNPSLIPVQQ